MRQLHYSNTKNSSNPIIKLSFELSLMIIEYTEVLESQKKFVVSKQLLRSGTSIGANINESQNAESKRDFIHKLKISAKEIEETDYWLALCLESKTYPAPDKVLFDKLHEVRKVLSKIISTSKRKIETLNN